MGSSIFVNMSTRNNWVESVPNVSSSDPRLIEDFRLYCKKKSDVFLLHCDTNLAINRTVFTIVGSLQAVLRALEILVDLCAAKVDLQAYSSIHPHLGALDVCPIVLLSGISHQEASDQINSWAVELAGKHELPIFWYQPDFNRPRERHLAFYRRGGLLHLRKRLSSGELKPKFGPDKWNDTLGATVIGIRPLMIAYNINLPPDQLPLAKEIASAIRSANPTSPFKGLKAMGWYAEDFGRVQISMNLYHVTEAAVPSIYQYCAQLAAQKNAALLGSEMIGVVPLRALARNLSDVRLMGHIEQVICDLGLDSVKAFRPIDHILDLCFEARTEVKLNFDVL